jgi:DNA-binding response OmpR family regulator
MSETKQILVVDDEHDIRLTLHTLLETLGYSVDEAENGRVAYEKLKEKKYDLMMLDILMPEMTGFELLDLLCKENDIQIPVIILSAKGEDSDLMKGYATGATYYITKPFQNREVMNAVRYLIEDLDPTQRAELEKML